MIEAGFACLDSGLNCASRTCLKDIGMTVIYGLEDEDLGIYEHT